MSCRPRNDTGGSAVIGAGLYSASRVAPEDLPVLETAGSVFGLQAAGGMLIKIGERLSALEDGAQVLGPDAVSYLLVKHRTENVAELFAETDAMNGGDPSPVTMAVAAYTVHHRNVAESMNPPNTHLAFVLERKMLVRVFGDVPQSTTVAYYTGSDPQDFANDANAKTVELVGRDGVMSELETEDPYSVLSRFDPCFADPADDTSFCVGYQYLGTAGESFMIPGDGETSFFVKESNPTFGPVYDALLLFAGLHKSAGG